MNRWRRDVRGMIPQSALIASALVAFLSLIGLFVVPVATEPIADMYLEPLRGGVLVGETFAVSVRIAAGVPVNAFKGDIGFDHTKLSVESIDYNTSLADLWARAPWYENGDGTLGFIGGTTRRGGFIGDGTLITITFRSLSAGDAAIHFSEARILKHDGLGTDVPLEESIDAIFAVENARVEQETVALPGPTTARIAIHHERPDTDLSGDGKHSLVDVSIFILNMTGDDPRYDFNVDGSIDSKDLSIIMSAKD